MKKISEPELVPGPREGTDPQDDTAGRENADSRDDADDQDDDATDPGGIVQDDGVGTGGDYVSFEMQGEMYALQMDRVQEIIRMPTLVRVPLGPPALEGLANLRGRVLPVVSLRRCCALPDAAHEESTRVVIVEAGGATLGLVVDRVAAVISVEPAQVESADSVQATVRSELLAAVIKETDTQMTTVLDVQHLVTSEFALFARHATSVAKAAALASSGQADSVDEDVADTLELVSFAVDGQEYAMPIDRVQEIVQAPDRVTPVPNAAPKVLGVMDLRGGLLPVLSLRSVFGLPVQALAPHNRIVVITVNREGHTYLVGVVMDTVREVLRVPLALVDPLPEVVSGGGRRTEVESVCRLEDGTRLVSVLSVDSLVDAELLASLDQTTSEQPTTQEATSMAEDDGASADDRGEDELFVVFRLQNEEYCVDVDTVQEIIRVPESLVRVPKTLDCIEGLVNLRGAVLPVVDLRTRLGLERLARDERQRIVVLITGGIRTGFVVDSVAEVARVAKVDLEPAPELSQEQAKVISRVANIPAQQRMLLVLDPGELLASTQVTGLIDELEPTDAAA